MVRSLARCVTVLVLAWLFAASAPTAASAAPCLADGSASAIDQYCDPLGDIVVPRSGTSSTTGARVPERVRRRLQRSGSDGSTLLRLAPEAARATEAPPAPRRPPAPDVDAAAAAAVADVGSDAGATLGSGSIAALALLTVVVAGCAVIDRRAR